MAKDKKPSWFKMFLHQKNVIDAVNDETAGRAIKGLFHYFATGEEPTLDQLSLVVFSALKPCVDASFEEFRKMSEAGTAGNMRRWGKDTSGGDTAQPCPITPNREDRGKKTEDRGKKTEDVYSKADKPPTSARFCPPSVDDVKSYCTEKGYNIDPQRFVDYYESIGWMVGRNKMKSWQAAVRTWASKEQEKAQPVEKKKSSIADAFPPIQTLG